MRNPSSDVSPVIIPGIVDNPLNIDEAVSPLSAPVSSAPPLAGIVPVGRSFRCSLVYCVPLPDRGDLRAVFLNGLACVRSLFNYELMLKYQQVINLT